MITTCLDARTRAKTHASGVLTAWSSAPTAQAAVAELAPLIDPGACCQLLAFFSPSYDAAALAAELAGAFPELPVAGCSTSGEITPAGTWDDSLVLVALPRAGFRAASEVVADVETLTIEGAAGAARRLRASMERACGGRPPAAGHAFGLMLIDGMSYREEMCVSAIAWALDGIPLVGGSAGDALRFERTAQIHNGRAYNNAAVLVLVESDCPVEVFRNDIFEPTDRKLVVTRCDPERRIVHELNAEPAALEYADAAGVRLHDLTPMCFASQPVVVRLGGDYYCRSIQRVNPDNSLSFFCAIDQGIVLTVARPRGLLRSVAAELERLDRALGGLDLVIGFDCVLRRVDAARRGTLSRVEDLYRRYNVVGFCSYGEQHGGMHLNQTFSGVAIGRPRAG